MVDPLFAYDEKRVKNNKNGVYPLCCEANEWGGGEATPGPKDSNRGESVALQVDLSR
jgi:hypothetical protein